MCTSRKRSIPWNPSHVRLFALCLHIPPFGCVYLLHKRVEHTPENAFIFSSVTACSLFNFCIIACLKRLSTGQPKMTGGATFHCQNYAEKASMSPIFVQLVNCSINQKLLYFFQALIHRFRYSRPTMRLITSRWYMGTNLAWDGAAAYPQEVPQDKFLEDDFTVHKVYVRVI